MITKKYLEKEKEGKQQCQNCLEFGHWTYECTRPQTYVYRPSRTKLFKQNKLFNIKDQKREESPEKKEQKNNNKEIKRSIESSSSSSSFSRSNSKKSNKSYSSGSSPDLESSSKSYSSGSSSFSRSDSENSKDKDEIIQTKKRKKLNEMLDNIQKYDKNKEKEKDKKKDKDRSKNRSRSRSRNHRRREHYRRRSQSRSRSRSHSRKDKRYENKNSFYGQYKLKKGERWKKIAEIEEENRSRSHSYERNGPFRKRPYQ